MKGVQQDASELFVHLLSKDSPTSNVFDLSYNDTTICTLCCDEKLKVTKDNMVWIHFDEMGCVQVGYQYFLNLNLKYSKSICVNEVRK